MIKTACFDYISDCLIGYYFVLKLVNRIRVFKIKHQLIHRDQPKIIKLCVKSTFSFFYNTTNIQHEFMSNM